MTDLLSRTTAGVRVRVPELIEARAAAEDAVALRTDREEITYAEFWRRARDTSRTLAGLGVREGDVVAVALPRSPDAVVAMLATWLAGAAFLPLDAAVPDEYRAHVLRDSRAVAVFDDAGGPRALNVTRTGVGPAGAYVIYTSGSTGTPKGVLVGHQALAGHVGAAVELLELDRDDVVLQFASLSFDVAQEEIWPTLAAGGTLVFHGAATVDAMTLASRVRDFGVSVLQVPTAYWRLLCAETKGTADPSFASVRTVIIGGENATASDVRLHRSGPLGHCTLVNGYGPTETVITATALVLRPDQDVPPTTGLPIGGPVGERRLYVLDEERRPVPDGVPGQLWIGGPLLATGYLNDDARTAGHFLADPFAGDAGARMYRTGDLVVRHPGGDLEFLGRLDNQVKVRGFRIELDEVDRHLLDITGVTAAAAITLDDGAGGKVLGAAVSVTDDGPSPEAIRGHLRERLPAHLVPGPIAVFDRLPLTTTGKIDRRAAAIRAAAEQAAVPESPGAAPATVLDQLVELLRTLLREPGFGPDDDFLAYGGDSLLALRVSGAMKERGWRLRPSELMAERSARGAAERMVPC